MGISGGSKRFFSCVVLAIFFCCSNRICGQSLADSVITLARINVGIEEIPRGSNWGKYVQAYLSHVNINFPAAWCAAFTAYLLKQHCIDTLLYSGWVPNWTTGKFKKYVVYNSSIDGKLYTNNIKPGDFGTIYFPSLKRDAHIFLIIEVKKNTVITIEGNTDPAGSREGYCVAIRERTLNQIHQLIRIFDE